MRVFPSLLLFILLPVSATAAGSPPLSAPGIDWLSKVTDQVNDLVTMHGDQLVTIGNIELAFLALLTLVGIVVRWQISHMVIGFRPVNYSIGDLIGFFINLAVCSVLLHYYNTPFPGAGISIHQIFPALAKVVSNIFDQSIVDGFLARVSKAANGTHAPGALDIVGAIVYSLVLLNICVMDLIMFAVNAFGFVVLGMFTLFGPLMIPLFITRNFKSKFWQWVDGLLVFSMFRAVSAGISFIYVNIFIGFFDNSVNGDYSLGHWLALLPTLILLNGGLLWSMFQVPRITGMIFGGVAGQAQTFVDTVTSNIVRFATAA